MSCFITFLSVLLKIQCRRFTFASFEALSRLLRLLTNNLPWKHRHVVVSSRQNDLYANGSPGGVPCLLSRTKLCRFYLSSNCLCSAKCFYWNLLKWRGTDPCELRNIHNYKHNWVLQLTSPLSPLSIRLVLQFSMKENIKIIMSIYLKHIRIH